MITLADPKPWAVKAGPIGPGAGVLNTEFPLSLILGGSNGSPQKKMKHALVVARETGWIDDAEAVIGGTISGQPWRIEDAQDHIVNDAYPDEYARAALNIIERPYQNVPLGRKMTRSELWQITLRHMGLCGNAFWYLDQRELAAGTPLATLYIQPWRMTPNEDKAGNLLSWQLDKTQNDPGTEIQLDELLHFMLRPPDEGHFGRGLVEIALIKAKNSVGFDRHIAQVLDAGGRLSGLLSPKAGDSLNNDQFQQLVVDARTVVEQPDAAKRLQILRGPVEFQQTTMTLKDLQIVELLKLMRDDLLALWGVPLSQIGGASPSGLNSGEVRKYDKQALWENANHPRVLVFSEQIQYGLIDRYADLGPVLDFEIEEPEFEDDSIRFDLLGKSLNTAMRNRERRALVNLNPLGPLAINPTTGVPYDDEVWLPNTMIPAFNAISTDTEMGEIGEAPVAPDATNEGQLDPETKVVPAPVKGQPPVPTSPGAVPVDRTVVNVQANPTVRGVSRSFTSGIKADLAISAAMPRALSLLRTSLDERYTPRLAAEVATVLAAQRDEIVARVKGNVAHLMGNPKDARVYFDAPKWDRKMTEALAPLLTRMAEEVDVHARAAITAPQLKAKPPIGPASAVAHALTKSSSKIALINERTREALIALVEEKLAEATAEGLTVEEASALLSDAIQNDASLLNGLGAWSQGRADMIARTEMMVAYNAAALGTYRDLGVEYVQLSDGTQFDAECADRDGAIMDIASADGLDEHPNGTLDFIPVTTQDAIAAGEAA